MYANVILCICFYVLHHLQNLTYLSHKYLHIHICMIIALPIFFISSCNTRHSSVVLANPSHSKSTFSTTEISHTKHVLYSHSYSTVQCDRQSPFCELVSNTSFLGGAASLQHNYSLNKGTKTSRSSALHHKLTIYHTPEACLASLTLFLREWL